MSNYFYFDANGTKRGPYDFQQLKERVANGMIEPHTPMETDDGHKGLAGQLPGLFPAAPPSASPVGPFCTNCGNTVDEKAIACMSCGASPTGHKKFCRQCGVGLNSEQIVCIKCGTGLTGNLGVGTAVASTATMTNAKSASPVSTFQEIEIEIEESAFTDDSDDDSDTGWATTGNYAIAATRAITSTKAVASIISAFNAKGVLLDTPKKKRLHDLVLNCISYYVLLAIWGIVNVASEVASYELSWWVEILFYIFTALYLVYFCTFLYRLWEEVPREFARTTPWKAPLLMLVPVFHLYWLFIVFLGLYKDMNKVTESYGLGRRFNETLILVFCVFWCVVWTGTYLAVLSVWLIPDDGSLMVDEAVLTTSEAVLVIALGAGFVILDAIVAVAAFGIIRKNILEFIDIKASMEK